MKYWCRDNTIRHSSNISICGMSYYLQMATTIDLWIFLNGYGLFVAWHLSLKKNDKLGIFNIQRIWKIIIILILWCGILVYCIIWNISYLEVNIGISFAYNAICVWMDEISHVKRNCCQRNDIRHLNQKCKMPKSYLENAF